MQAERDYDLNRAAELKYGTLVSLQAQLNKVEDELAAKSSSGSGMLREEVTEDDISEVISRHAHPSHFLLHVLWSYCWPILPLFWFCCGGKHHRSRLPPKGMALHTHRTSGGAA